MTSDRIFVWTWLPGHGEPVPAGVLEHLDGSAELGFRYGDRYVERDGALSLAPGLPLAAGVTYGPTANLGMPGFIRDAMPDSWGRRVIINRLTGGAADADDAAHYPDDVYLLESDSNRLGAIDFQSSATDYVAREERASLDDLQRAADFVQAGEPLPPTLAAAVIGGTAIGGARPKALISDNGTEYIAKFSTSDDPLDVVGAEAASMVLARAVGIPVASSSITRSLGRKVLLMERFDRPRTGGRKHVISALTMLGLPETYLPLGSYPDLLDVLRRDSASAAGLGEAVFLRVAFNIAISNSDDHLRNHAAFWDGAHLELTPAYDLSPVARSGESANQALAYGRNGERESNLARLIGVCQAYGLNTEEARSLVERMLDAIRDAWEEAADAAELTTVDRTALWGRQFLNPGALYGL